MQKPLEDLYNQYSQVSAIKTLYRNPLGFIDIGARGGFHPVMDNLRKLTAVMGFEPDKTGYNDLINSPNYNQNWAVTELLPIALGHKRETRDLNLHSVPTNHSLLPSNPIFVERYKMEKWKLVGKEAMKTMSLDEILAQREDKEIKWGEIIKLDTQGTEYEILQGAIGTLRKNTVAVICEVSFCELYQGQKLFSDVELFLREIGFSFYGFNESHFRSTKRFNKRTTRTRERIIQADAIFFKDPFDQENTFELSIRQAQVLSICAMQLGFFDYAEEVADKLWANDDDLKLFKSLLNFLSNKSPADTYENLKSLYKKVRENIDDANVVVGKYIDEHRHFNDFSEF